MSLHAKHVNRICAIRGCIIPCVKDRKTVSEKPKPGCSRPFTKKTIKTVQNLRDCKKYKDTDIDLILNSSNLPSRICEKCYSQVRSYPENLPKSLIVSDWYKTLKTRNNFSKFNTHLSIENLADLEPHVASCPLVCQMIVNSNKNLIKGVKTDADLKAAALNLELRELELEKQLIEKKRRQLELNSRLKFDVNNNVSTPTSTKYSKSLPKIPKSKLRHHKRRTCEVCFQLIKPGGHRTCSAKIKAADTLVKVLTDRNIQQPVASQIINQEIPKNSVNAKLQTLNSPMLIVLYCINLLN